MERCSGNLIPELANPLSLFTDVALEHSVTTAVLNENDISHGLSRNVSGSDFITCQSVEDNVNPIQDLSLRPPYQFFPCNFNKRRI